jgi:ubiquinone/menaquinone biosynthesis C-methylase UbiE
MAEFDWHERFLAQSRWTFGLRQFLYQQVDIKEDSHILEVGCGTGVITAELNSFTKIKPIGMDIDLPRVQQAAALHPEPAFACADGYALPFPSNSIDLVFSHYYFLWLKDPIQSLLEIRRVLKPGGWMAALSEPDHLARVDNPQSLWKLGEMQTNALIQQGANPMAGRMLPQYFTKAGFEEIQFGVSGFQASPTEIPEWLESEWATLKHDLQDSATESELIQWQERDVQARKEGSRVLWVPTFYAYGKKSY